MNKTSKQCLLFLICETATHWGSGTDQGYIDLSIQREVHTGFPMAYGSSLKGALRQAVEKIVSSAKFQHWDDEDTKIHRCFGFDDVDLPNKSAKDQLNKVFKETRNSAALTISDGRLLFFPVKSASGVFAWITCPMVLSRFFTDASRCELDISTLGFPTDWHNTNLIADDNPLSLGETEDGELVVLDSTGYHCQVSDEWTKCCNWMAKQIHLDSFWSSLLQKNSILLPNEEFSMIVRQKTEVITRNKINNKTGTVSDTGLFNEEYLPAESILYTPIFSIDELTEQKRMTAEEVMKFFQEKIQASGVVQMGGNATIGKGLVRQQFCDFSSTSA
ncbi:MAG: type III-B CRISPR module RAMP protein Cmr4 [Flammeovirgaceae bacterium]